MCTLSMHAFDQNLDHLRMYRLLICKLDCIIIKLSRLYCNALRPVAPVIR